MFRSCFLILLIVYALCAPIRRERSPGNSEKSDCSSKQTTKKSSHGNSTTDFSCSPSTSDVLSTPQNLLKQASQQGSNAPTKCYFGVKRRGSLETHQRLSISEVSNECSTVLTPMSSLVSKKIKDLYGCTNALDLVLCRGEGLCNLDFSTVETESRWNGEKICENHLEELLLAWNRKERNHFLHKKSSAQAKCSMPTEIGFEHVGRYGRPAATRPNDKNIEKRDSFAILKSYGILIHPGLPVCAEHKRFVSGIGQPEQSKQPDQQKKTIEQVVEEPEECTKDPQDVAYTPRRPKTNEQNSDKSCTTLKRSFLEFAKAANVRRVLPSSTSFQNLDSKTKKRKACEARKLIDRMFDIMAPTGKSELKQIVMQDTEDIWTQKRNDKFGGLMTYIADAYRRAENRAERYVILSLIANVVPLSQIRVYIPGLTYHVYDVARKYRRFSKENLARTSERYNPVSVNLFIEFITSNVIMSPFTFGSKKAKFSSGVSIELPKTIRKQTATEIIAMFKKYLIEEDREQFLMSDSTYYRILDVCAATTQKASTCVDYYLADGIEAGEQVKDVLEKWKTGNVIDDDLHKQLVHDLEDAIHYFRTDYGLHIKEDSRVPDHCARYALSDVSDLNFSSKCKHRHDLRCERCEKARNVFEDIQQFIDDLVVSREDEYKIGGTVAMLHTLENFREDRDQISDCLEKIFEMKKHILRAQVTDKQRSMVISNLEENEGLVTMDFAQKLLPQKYRERQTEYFGKRGMSYHISHITANISKQIVTHSFVHLLRGELQDSDAVTSIIKHFLQELKKMNIKKVFLRSDNAGAYHCASTIGSLFEISKTTGVMIAHYLFSEPQNGKSSCDRVASLVKRKVHTWVDAGNDVADIDQFYFSITSKKPLLGTSVFLARVERPVEKRTFKNQIDSISILFDFVFSKDSVTAFRYNGLGNGQLIKTESLSPNKAHLIIEQAGGFLADQSKASLERLKIEKNEETEFWYTKQCAKRANCVKEPMQFSDILTEDDQHLNNNPSNNGYFFCPTPGCSAAYRHYKNLEKHQTIGKHNIAPEKITLKDHALQSFSNRLEDLGRLDGAIPDEVNEAISSLEGSSDDMESSLQEGWALRTRKISGRFSSDVRAYLMNLFAEGERTKRKYDGKQVAKMMKEEKNSDGTRRFQAMDRLNDRQINSFFSRTAQKKNYESATRTIRSDVTAMDEEATENEEEDDEDEFSDDYELVYFKDPLFSTSLDIELRKAVKIENDNIFDSTAGIYIDHGEVDSKLGTDAKHAKNDSN